MKMHLFSLCTGLLFVISLINPQKDGGEHTHTPTSSEHVQITDDLVGTWKIDLRPTPDAAPYYEEMIITEVKDGRVFGTFYNSPIQYGTINTDWDKVVFAFITLDAGGSTYNTTVEFKGDKLIGTTHSLGRGFLSVWTGARAVAE